jgi:ComF family protein
MIFKLFEKIFSFLFPPICVSCNSEKTNTNICNHCVEKISVNREITQPWIFSLYRYRTEEMNSCIRHIKNFPDQEIVQQLLLKKKIMIIGWVTGITRYNKVSKVILVPVPLHQSRFIERGYNQAEIIAQALQNVLKLHTNNIVIEIDTKLIKKSKKTDKQALIHDRKVRLKNIHDAFSINTENLSFIENSIVIIIDDITTTGGTMVEMRQLFGEHSEHVFGFTLGH